MMPWGPPALQATFDGNPDYLALFLSQSISHLDQYTHFYPSQWAMVVTVMVTLEGEAAEWVADLHTEHAWELADAGLFVEVLQVQRAEGELLALTQRSQAVAEYVCEFCQVASKLRAVGLVPGHY